MQPAFTKGAFSVRKQEQRFAKSAHRLLGGPIGFFAILADAMPPIRPFTFIAPKQSRLGRAFQLDQELTPRFLSSYGWARPFFQIFGADGTLSIIRRAGGRGLLQYLHDRLA